MIGNAEMVSNEAEAADRELLERQNAPLFIGLTAYLHTCWDAAKNAKTPVEQKMLKAMRQRNGEYEADKMSAIQKQGGSTIFMGITEVKCRAGESWLRDILLDTGTPPWDLGPTPIPELSPKQTSELENVFAENILAIVESTGKAPTPAEVSEMKEMVTQDYRFKVLMEAQNRADKMKLKISDQFAQGGWPDAFNEFVTDIVTFPCAFIKGPVVRRQRTLKWEQNDQGATIARAGEELAPEYERVDPFKIYPEPGITHIDEGYLFEHHPLTRMELSELIGVPSYDEEAIRKLLSEGNSGSWINEGIKSAKEEAEGKTGVDDSPTTIFDALEFSGKISGKMLRDWGLDEEEVPDAAREYESCVWICGDYIIKAVLNYDPLGEKPYAKTSLIKSPGAFWGRGIPEVIEDVQNICNAAARALVNNMGISSGPQVEVNLERIPANEDITQMYPWKIWQVTNDPMGSSAPAVRFNQPDDNATTLMAVYDKFSNLADDHSGIPSYISGDLNVSGAGRTASGLSMLMGSAGKGIRQVVMHIDSDVIKKIVHRQFVYNMRYDADESIKGDVEIIARGAINLAVKETVNVRRIEFLNATANEIDMEIVGRDGRASILREVAKGLQMPVDDIIPSREKAGFTARETAKLAKLDGPSQQPGGSTPTQPDGSPKGGMDGNTVSNRSTGGVA